MTWHVVDGPAMRKAGVRLSVRPDAGGAVRGAAVAESSDGSGTGLVRTAALRTGGHASGPLPRVHSGRHWALDADSGERTGMLDRADVILGHLPRPGARLLPEVAWLLLTYPGCGLAMLPGAHGVWIGMLRNAVPLRAVGGEELSLLPSCLYGWVTAGHEPLELADVTPVVEAPPDAAPSAPRPRG